MARTDAGNAIKLATGDSISGRFRIQSIYAVAAVTLTDGTNEFADLQAAGDTIHFPIGLQVDGITVSGTGPVFIYLA